MWRYLFCLIPAVAVAQVEQGPPNAAFEPAFEGQTREAALPESEIEISVYSSGFSFPWGIAPLPGGAFLVTERGGVLKRVTDDGSVTVIDGVPQVEALRQGGLLDVSVSADFAETGVIHLSYSKAVDGGIALAVARGVLVGDALEQVEDVFVQAPPRSGGVHFGSRIVVGDGGIWITAGDRGSPDLAQEDNTIGKVIWLPEGGEPQVWSTGHRNVQGAILREGELWTVEHGPRGGDELNRLEQGLNYGWPVISYGIDYGGSDVGEGVAIAEGFEQPVYYWDPVIAPGGMGVYPTDAAFEPWRGDLFIASLNPGGVVRLKLEQGRVVGEERMLRDVGRVRDVEVLQNGDLLVLPDAPDADILRVTPVAGATP